jgi:hypothetical protein
MRVVFCVWLWYFFYHSVVSCSDVSGPAFVGLSIRPQDDALLHLVKKGLDLVKVVANIISLEKTQIFEVERLLVSANDAINVVTYDRQTDGPEFPQVIIPVIEATGVANAFRFTDTLTPTNTASNAYRDSIVSFGVRPNASIPALPIATFLTGQPI